MSDETATQRWLERARMTWDERAESFDVTSSANATGPDRKAEIDFVVETLSLPAGVRILDAGCGVGHFAIALAEHGFQVDAVDLSPAMIERSRVNAATAGVSIAFSVGDLASLSAPDAAYGAIVSRVALQFSPHLSTALDEFERVLTPSGKMWLAVPGALSPVYRHSWRRFLDDEPDDMNYVVPWELIHLLEARGWFIDAQWGSFDAIGRDAGNPVGAYDVSQLPLAVQQASATVWNIIATRAG
ncbi:MAG: class I SAM-dependent methyltransferase [Thermomicrobiales bacterium]|nr:class I SAM-dependent methyltransferase [Thermomicrobiales bacterium]MCO5220022.1 class I SAM-dependent methyltransferase [Thermomicrobiales bacterium]